MIFMTQNQVKYKKNNYEINMILIQNMPVIPPDLIEKQKAPIKSNPK